MSDDEFDARFAGLRDVEPPAALQRDTLAAYAALRRPRRAWRWPVAVALAAVALFAVQTGAPDKGDPAQFVPRGAGEVVPEIDLRVAVRSGDTLSRMSADTRYRAGDTLLFRVTTPSPMDLTLSRDGVVIWQGPVPGGDHDLPVGYTFDAGDGPAVFRVEGGGASAQAHVQAVSP